MKITDVRTLKLAVAIPAEHQWRNETGVKVRHEAALILIETDEGLLGYGESGGSPPVTEAIVATRLKPLLLGQDPARITYLWEAMYSGKRLDLALGSGRAYAGRNLRGEVLCAMSGVDTGLWDLRGKALGEPLHRLLGGAVRDRVQAYASGGWAPVGQAGDEAREYLTRGYDAVKIRVGGMDTEDFPRRSLQRLEEVREAVGPSRDLMMDAHGALTPQQASALAAAAQDLDIRWFEEPVAAGEDLPGLAAVRRRTRIPIATGEAEQTRFAFADIIAADAADVLQPDLAIAGGITETRRIAALADAHGVSVELHVWGSAVLHAASLQFIAATPNTTMIETGQGWNPLLTDLADPAPAPGPDGSCPVPDRPGLGIELAPDLERRYPWS